MSGVFRTSKAVAVWWIAVKMVQLVSPKRFSALIKGKARTGTAGVPPDVSGKFTTVSQEAEFGAPACSVSQILLTFYLYFGGVCAILYKTNYVQRAGFSDAQ